MSEEDYGLGILGYGGVGQGGLIKVVELVIWFVCLAGFALFLTCFGLSQCVVKQRW